MTTIAFDGSMLAADRQCSSGNTKHGRTCKLLTHNGHMLSFTGGFVEGLALVEWFKAGADTKNPPKVGESSGSTLVVVTPDNELVVYEHPYLSPLTFLNKVQAFGSGRDFALAAMHLGFDAKRAVEVASEFDLYTGGGVDTCVMP